MTYEENIKRDIAVLMKNYGIDDVDYVTSFEDTTESTGYCESCYYEYAAVKVCYRTKNGGNKTWIYSDDFGSLIYALDNLGD